jgi:hypothetical protein
MKPEAGTDANGDHRFAKRDQDDESMALGEVLGRDPPARAHADQGGACAVDRERGDPRRQARVAA